jgi:lipoprotein-releasing system permease protein
MRFELFLAARYLRAKRRQAVVGVVTGISVAGVAAGVAALIIALAITNGMRQDLQSRLLSTTAHVELMRMNSDGIRDWRPLLARLQQQPHVTAAAPGFYGQVLVSRGPRAGFALLKGILPAEEERVSNLLSTVDAKSIAAMGPEERASGDLPPILLGHDLAEQLGALPGDTVMVTSPQGDLTPIGIVPRYQQYRLVGVFTSGFYQYDSAMGFLRLSDSQQLFSEPDLITVLSFRIDNLYKADRIGHELELAAGPGYQTTNWMEQNRELFRALKLEQIVTFIVIALIVCVAALNILIALTMMVMEKTRDIAVLMSFGVRPNQVRMVFLLQGLLISLMGTVVGLALGYLGAWAGGHYHFIHLSAEVYSIDTLPFRPRVLDGVLVAAVSLGVSLLATLYPSGSAAKVLPAEALRYE